MAGFTVNGFGAADSYYKLKDIRTQQCSRCRKDTMHALMELKMKIRLLYIPTVSIGTKYAVVCTQCKQGYYVNEDQKNFILSHPSSCISVSGEGVTFHGYSESQKVALSPAPKAQPKNTCTCGTALSDDDLFCPGCGKKQEAVPAPPPVAEPTASCIQCGAALSEGDMFCSACGKKQEAVPAPPPVAEPTASCIQCGAALSQGDMFCSACGKKQEAVPAPPPVAEPTASCIQCGAALSQGDMFCPACGKKQEAAPAPPPVAEPTASCIQCGAALSEGDMFCSACGKKQAEDLVPPPKPKLYCTCGNVLNDGEETCVSCRMGIFKTRKAVCPICKLMFKADKEECPICGSKLVQK